MRPAFIFPFGLACLPASALADMTSDLLNTPQIQVQRREVVQAAIRRFKQGESRKSGLVDALNAKIASSEGCSSTVALDKAAVRAAGMIAMRIVFFASRNTATHPDAIAAWIAQDNASAANAMWLLMDDQTEQRADPNFPRLPGTRVAGRMSWWLTRITVGILTRMTEAAMSPFWVWACREVDALYLADVDAGETRQSFGGPTSPVKNKGSALSPFRHLRNSCVVQ